MKTDLQSVVSNVRKITPDITGLAILNTNKEYQSGKTQKPSTHQNWNRAVNTIRLFFTK